MYYYVNIGIYPFLKSWPGLPLIRIVYQREDFRDAAGGSGLDDGGGNPSPWEGGYWAKAVVGYGTRGARLDNS